MRKDVKLGFAIGGVLLAVLVVYVVAISGSSDKTEVAQDDGQDKVAVTGDGKVTLEPDDAAGGPPKTPPVPPSAPAAQYTPPAGGRTDPFEADKQAGQAKPSEVAQGSGSAKKDDWNKILNDQLMLMTETPTAAPTATPVAPAPSTAVLPPPAAEAVAPAPLPASPPTVQPIAGATEAASTPPVPPSATDTGSTVVGTIGQPASTGSSITPTGGREHTVQMGETLSSISMAAYGNPNFYPHIQRANPTLNPNRLKPGMKILLPDVSAVRPQAAAAGSDLAAPATVAATIDASKQYRVQPGDSLHKIAQALYGVSTNADKIYQLNKPAIGEDPHRLKVGQVLELPAPPSAATAGR